MNASSTLLAEPGPRGVALRLVEPGEVAEPWHHDGIRSVTPDLTTLIERVQHGD